MLYVSSFGYFVACLFVLLARYTLLSMLAVVAWLAVAPLSPVIYQSVLLSSIKVLPLYKR